MMMQDPNTGQWVQVPDPMRIRVPWLRHEIGAGEIVHAATEAMGVQPCTPCEERRRRMNAALVFAPWAT